MLDKKIIEELERKEGKRLTTGDCQWLAIKIQELTKEVVGETTLKRMLGFTSDKNITPRLSTLNILANFLGYKDYEEMAVVLGLQGVVISEYAERDTLRSIDLNIGDNIEIKYSPNRLFVMKYVGDNRFILEEVINSQNLKAGDIVTITHFSKGLPLYMVEVNRDGKNLGAYESAKNGGLTSIELIL